MTKEELLKPRYKTLCRYPDSPLRIGQIINGETFNVTGGTKFHCADYPSIFQKLEWWNDREVNELPEYLKIEDMVIKVDVYLKDVGFNFYYGESAGYGKRSFEETNPIPATESEYLTYINNQK